MKSVTENSIMTLLCWMVVAQARATGVSKNLNDFLYVFNGVYDDSDQVVWDQNNRDVTRLRMMPLNIPALNGPVFYVDESLNGVFYRQEVNTVTEDIDERIHVTPYNFTDSSRPDPSRINLDDLEKLTLQDLRSGPNCTFTYWTVVPGLYTALRTYCRPSVNKQHPLYSLEVSCYSYSGTPPIFYPGTETLAPFTLTRKGERFPAINIPANYVGPCDKKQ